MSSTKFSQTYEPKYTRIKLIWSQIEWQFDFIIYLFDSGKSSQQWQNHINKRHIWNKNAVLRTAHTLGSFEIVNTPKNYVVAMYSCFYIVSPAIKSKYKNQTKQSMTILLQYSPPKLNSNCNKNPIQTNPKQ